MALVAGGGGFTPLSPQARFLKEQARRNAGQTISSPSKAPKPKASNKVSSSSSGSRSLASSGPTAAEKKAAKNLKDIAAYNAQSLRDQLAGTLSNYDLADEQNEALAGLQKTQNSEKGASERFAQNKRLQMATQGMLGAAGNALQGSGAINTIDMLRGRSDLDNGETLDTLKQNQNTVMNALREALNANITARRDAVDTARSSLRGIEADTAAQLNNIDPSLYAAPGTGSADFGDIAYTPPSTPTSLVPGSGYLMPALSNQARQTAPNRTGNSYFDRLLNLYKGRTR